MCAAIDLERDRPRVSVGDEVVAERIEIQHSFARRQVRVPPLAGVVRQVHVSQPLAEPSAHLDQVVLGDGRVTRVEHEGGNPSSSSRSWFAWNVMLRRPILTGNMFSIATTARLLGEDRQLLVEPAAVGAANGRAGACTTTGTSACSATRIARSILPIGSVPHTFLVTSSEGAWIARS